MATYSQDEQIGCKLPAGTLARIRRVLPAGQRPAEWAREQLLAALDRIEEAKEGEP